MAASFADAELRAPEADAFGIVVGRARITGGQRSRIHGLFDRIVGLRELHGQRTAAAAQWRLAAFPRFEASEVRKHLVPRPAGRTAARPPLEVAARTARERHHV